MRRWKAALAPLFRSGGRLTGPQVFHALPRETGSPDAGPAQCKPRVQRLAFVNRPSVDLVVVIDTSGSMATELPKIARWLAELELEIVTSKADAQLLVVAQQRDLNRRPKADGGSFNLGVQSNDALDVLLAGAKEGNDRWTDSLRSSADLHIVVVTDDNARGRGAQYVARLTEALGGTRFSVNLLGGLDTADRGLLSADQPVAETTCSGDGFLGLNPGLGYQEAARLTNGLRAPFCYEASRRALSAELLRAPPQLGTCAWWLDAPGHRVERVDAVGPRHPSTGLIRERVLSSCYATRRSYRLADSLLVLCESTCSALRSEGYDAVEVKLECVE